jgi:glycosyltransferase involved in cell wall biosynthesis
MIDGNYGFQTNTSLKSGRSRAVSKRLSNKMQTLRKILKLLPKKLWLAINQDLPYTIGVLWLSKKAKLFFLCSKEELKRLKYFLNFGKAKVVPHFVEKRLLSIRPQEARKKLNLEGFKVITLQGFIFPGKGHHLMVEAISELPSDVIVVFAGGLCPGNEKYYNEIHETAVMKGVSHRLRVTGYLPEDELICYLIATHLAVCPFMRLSASGSLSTWISTGRPLLSSDLPQIAEYNEIVSGAIKTFKPYTPSALAKMIRKLLPKCRESEDSAVVNLRERLSLPKIFDQHLTAYYSVLSQKAKKE